MRRADGAFFRDFEGDTAVRIARRPVSPFCGIFKGTLLINAANSLLPQKPQVCGKSRALSQKCDFGTRENYSQNCSRNLFRADETNFREWEGKPAVRFARQRFLPLSAIFKGTPLYDRGNSPSSRKPCGKLGEKSKSAILDFSKSLGFTERFTKLFTKKVLSG